MVRFLALFGTLVLLCCGPAKSATIGLSLPLTGDYAAFGNRFQIGAKQAFKDAQTPHQLAIQDDKCTAEGAEQAAQHFHELETGSVFGFLCNASAKAAAGFLRQSGIPVIVSGARSLRLVKDREREDWNLWRMSPGDDYPVSVAAKTILTNWQNTPFAIVDDGTIFGRRFADNLRQQLQEHAIEPQVIETFRTGLSTQAALIRRLNRAGVAAVFIAALDPGDLVTIVNDSVRLSVPLNFIATEALRVLPFLENTKTGAVPLQIINWPDVEQTGVSALDKEGLIDRHYLMGYAAAQIALQLQGNLSAEDVTLTPNRVFDTILGKISFNADGSSTFNPYRVQEWNGSSFVTVQPEADR